MPDEEKNKIESKEPDVEAEVKKGRPLKKYGIYFAIVLAMVAGAYLVTSKVVKPMFAGNDTGLEGNDRESSAAGDKKKTDHKTLAEYGSGDGHGSNIFLIEDLIVNPAGTGGRRFLSTSIGFELKTAEVSGLFEQREAIVRDALITILSSQSIPELSDFKQRERLRKLIKLRVEKLLHTEEIGAVYFTEFVLQ